MNIIYRLFHYLTEQNPVNIDPLVNMSLRERADLPPWHEAAPIVDSPDVHNLC